MKYTEEMSGIDGCPPEKAIAQQKLAFRFAHQDLADSRNYLPVAKISPVRLEQEKSTHRQCSMWGLSCFTTLELAKQKWQRIAATSPRFPNTVGSQIAKVALADDDGVMTKPNHEGHFDFFESTDCDLTDRLESVGDANA